MINVPNPISPKMTELKNKKDRARMRGNGSAKKVKELRDKKSAGQNNINDREARIAMVLAGEDFPAASDIDAQITTELLNWQAAEEAEQSLAQPLATAKFEASTAVLLGLKKPHDAVVNPMVTALAEVVAKAWVELFQLSRDLKDKEVGWRNGVCDLVPALVDLFGPPTPYSPLADFLRLAVASGYISAGSVPREFRA